jgi:hypothetical protein
MAELSKNGARVMTGGFMESSSAYCGTGSTLEACLAVMTKIPNRAVGTQVDPAMLQRLFAPVAFPLTGQCKPSQNKNPLQASSADFCVRHACDINTAT